MISSLLAELELIVSEQGGVGKELSNKLVALCERHEARLEKENAELVARIRELENELKQQRAGLEYIDWNGVSIKKLPDGGYSDTPFCPICKKPLIITPKSTRLYCGSPDCNYLPRLNLRVFQEYLKSLP